MLTAKHSIILFAVTAPKSAIEDTQDTRLYIAKNNDKHQN